MKKSTAEKIESAKSIIEFARKELDKLSKKTFLFFIAEHKKMYPVDDCTGTQHDYDELMYNYADRKQKANSERITCVLNHMQENRRNLKKWRGLLDA